MERPTRPKILRDIDECLGKALGEVDGVFSVRTAGVDFAGGTNVVVKIHVEAKHQRALGRWMERQLKYNKETGRW